LLLFPRSSIGIKTCLRMANSVGVIDSDYRGTIHAMYENIFCVPHHINQGDRIAQGIIVPIPKVEFEEVEELSTTERGEGGFGSTGV
jgi:dUTP diphosphatase